MVHEFVNSDGLNALITVGTDADQNYQNYILRGNIKRYEIHLVFCMALQVLHRRVTGVIPEPVLVSF